MSLIFEAGNSFHATMCDVDVWTNQNFVSLGLSNKKILFMAKSSLPPGVRLWIFDA